MRFIKVTTLLIFTTWGSLFLLANDNWLENQPPEFKKVVPVLNNSLNLALDYHELNEFNKELETINNALELCAANNGVDELFTASFWSQKGICLKSLGFLDESIESFRESLRIKILKLGKNAEEVHANHIELGLLYDQLKQTDDAIFHFEKVISKKPKDETKNQIRGHIYSILGRLYESKGSYDLSIQSHLKALKYFEQKLGGNHPQLINYHDNLGLSYQLNRNFRAAIIHFEKAQEIQEANGQRNLTDIASRLNLIGQLYSNLGEYKMALKKQMDALKFYIELHGPDHIQVALSCSNVGYQYQKLGNLDNAQKFHEESLAIRSKLLTPQDPRIAVGLSNLGVINLELGKFPEAVNLLQKGLSIDSIQLGLNHPRVIQYYNNLGFAHLNLNLPQKALDFHEKALRLIPEINVSKEEELAYSGILDTTYNHLANTHGELGSFSKAISYLNLSLSLRLKNQGPSHINVATVYNNLGSIYSKLGELYLSKINFEKALEIMKLRLGYNHKNTATCLSNLGMVEHYLGNHTQAVLLLHQSLEIQESVLDSNHSDIARTYNNLIAPHTFKGDFKNAKKYYDLALKTNIERYGLKHAKITATYTNGAFLHQTLGEYKKAISLYEKCLKIDRELNGDFHPNVGTTLNSLGSVLLLNKEPELAISSLSEALEILSKSLGESHPTLISVHEHLMTAFLMNDQKSFATQHALKKSVIDENFISRIFSYLPKHERLKFMQNRDPFFLLGNLENLELLSSTALKRKGLILDTILEDRRLHSGEKYLELNTILERRNETLLNLEKFSNFSHNDIKKRKVLENRILEFDDELKRMTDSPKIARRAFALTVKDLSNAIPHNHVLIDFIKYNQIDNLNNDKKKNKIAEMITCYGAILYLKDSNQPQWLHLGNSDPIDSSIHNLKVALRNSGTGVKSALHKTYTSIIRPIIDLLPQEIDTLMVCPDSELNFVPFQALVDDQGSFLCEKFKVLNISASRDLLLANDSHSGSKKVSIFANPLFDLEVSKQSNLLALGSLRVKTLRNLGFLPLDGTQKEAQRIREIVSNHQLLVDLKTGSDASEHNLKKISSPRILHLATHGFYISGENQGENDPLSFLNRQSSKERIYNPMHRSGLALAGAKSTIRLLKDDKYLDPQTDGILTADEASTLDLSSTWLTVLSACDTGSGFARTGEGVLGLRRAFAMAGTQNLVLTLWPVDDLFTKDFMVSFYEEALESGNAPNSMAKVQRDWLVKLREERSISQAVKLAGPFVLTFRGNPELN